MAEALRKLPIGEKMGDRWEVIKLVGEGGFGAVYEVKDTKGDEDRRFALKVEDLNAPKREQVMCMEVVILRRMRMKRIRDGSHRPNHFCQLEAVGQSLEFRFMVMTSVGKSVSQLRRRCGGKFSGRTVAHVAIESLTAIRELHDIGFLHRDIKPSNLAIGQEPNTRELYLIDFGLCRLYQHEDGRLRRPRDIAGFRGTLTYAPIACHRNEDMCRRDDVWSWLYMLIELSCGRVPWHKEMRETMNMPFEVQSERIGKVKKDLNATPTDLTTGCAMEFLELHSEISSLKYYDQMLTALAKTQKRRQQPEKDGEALDWEPGGKYYDIPSARR